MFKGEIEIMGYSFIPFFEDEKKDGYCRNCSHRDCIEIRKLRETICKICNKQFKGGDTFTENKEFGIVHFDCLREKLGV
jgi:hypothetical protein